MKLFRKVRKWTSSKPEVGAQAPDSGTEKSVMFRPEYDLAKAEAQTTSSTLADGAEYVAMDDDQREPNKTGETVVGDDEDDEDDENNDDYSAMEDVHKIPSFLFPHDDPKNMTWARKLAIRLMGQTWYNPNAHKDDQRTKLLQQNSQDGPEIRPPIVTRREIPSLEKAWAYYEHYALPRFLVEENQDMNNLSRADPGENQRPTKLYDPLWTPLSQMGDFGLGIGLYFSTLRAITVLTFVAGLVNIPNIIYFASQEYSDGQQGINPLMRGSAICTRKEWVPCIDCDSDEFPSNRYYELSGVDAYGYSRVLIFVLKNNCDGATLKQGLINYGTMALIVLGIMLLNRFQKHMEVAFDEDEQTAQDYSVRIKNPPGDARDPDEWRSYFKQSFGADATVITISLENDALVNALRERRECLRQIELQVDPGTSLGHLNLARMAAEAEKSRNSFQRVIAKFMPGLPELFGRKADLEARIAGWAQLDYPSSDIFVTFETEADQRRVLTALNVGKIDAEQNNTHRVESHCLFRGDYVLHATEPDEPNTIRWADLNIKMADKMKPLVTTTICSAIIIIMIALIIRFIHNRSVTFGATAIALFNIVFPVIAKMLTDIERHSSESQKQTSLYFKIAAFRWINTAVIISIITDFTETLATAESGGVVPSIYAIFFAEIVTTNAIQLADVLGHFDRHILAPRARTQDAMNLLMKGQEVEFAERYTNMTKILFLALWYCSIFPAALFMCSFALFVNYFTDRFGLMRTWRRLPNLGTKISKFSRQYFFPSAIVAMAVMSSYFWSGFPFDDLCVYNGEIPYQYKGSHYFMKNGESVSITLDYGSQMYRYCSQDLIRYRSPSFPALSIWQPEGDEWMSEDQELLVNIFGITSVVIVVVVLLFFLFLGYKALIKYCKGKYSPVGDDQGINYSDVKSISAYVPQVNSSVYSYPLLACDISKVDSSVLDWTDPDRPHSYYDLTQDAYELIGEFHVKDNRVFSILAHYPPQTETIDKERLV